MLSTSEQESSGRGLRYLAFFAFATIILTWPIAFSLGRPTSTNPDYFSNLWNFWWFKTSVLLEHTSPYWTDYLYFPTGISLARHTLSPLNSLVGALLSFGVNLHAAYNTLLLLHFTLSGWTFFLLARYLTGNTRGALLAGLVYSFCPFHYRYLSHINVATFEFLPLVVLYSLKVYREGGARNTMLTVLFMAMIAASYNYAVVYAFLVIGLLALAGKLWNGEVRFVVGLKRLLIAGSIAVAAVFIVSMPLVLTVVKDVSANASQATAVPANPLRANDLVGHYWMAQPDGMIVSWPTMVGYSTLLLLALGYREVVKQRFWLLVGAVFLVMSLGDTLMIAGNDTGILMPHKYLKTLPVLSMLRKPDRAFLMIQFVVALLCAFSWRHLSRLFKSTRRELVCWIGITSLIMVETTGIPFAQFSYKCPSYLANLGRSSEVDSKSEIKSLVNLPARPGSGIEARYDYFQTFNSIKMAQGYVTSLAMTGSLEDEANGLRLAYRAFEHGDYARLLVRLEKLGTDLVVLHKIVPKLREPTDLDSTIVWAPFLLVRHGLVEGDQKGPFVDTRVSGKVISEERRALEKTFGPPIHEDSDIVVFDTRRGHRVRSHTAGGGVGKQ
jgi:hypothetical protein